MASTQLSPGVVVLERDLTNVVNSTVDNVAAVVGAFEKGPIEDITTITSEKELLATFGKPNNLNYEYWFTAAQFLLYGGSLRVVRADNSALRMRLIQHNSLSLHLAQQIQYLLLSQQLTLT